MDNTNCTENQNRTKMQIDNKDTFLNSQSELLKTRHYSIKDSILFDPKYHLDSLFQINQEHGNEKPSIENNKFEESTFN